MNPANGDLLEFGEFYGYRYEIRHDGAGYRNGYVTIEASHPSIPITRENPIFYVHGGIECTSGDPDREDVYWLGFSCSQWNDAPDPALEPRDAELARIMRRSRALQPKGTMKIVRDQDYVRNECQFLAAQIAASSRESTPKTYRQVEKDYRVSRYSHGTICELLLANPKVPLALKAEITRRCIPITTPS